MRKLGKTPDGAESRQLSTCLPIDLWDEIHQIAAAEERKVAEQVRYWIRQSILAYRKENPCP